MVKDSETLKEMGKRIREKRTAMRLTQEQLADLAFVTPQFVSYAESGQRSMRPENLVHLANALDVSVDYLLRGERTAVDDVILVEKLRRLPDEQLRILEMMVDLLSKQENRPLGD